MFSDGSTCYADAGMTIVMGRAERREVVETEHERDLENLLQRLVTPKFKITRMGQTMPDAVLGCFGAEG